MCTAARPRRSRPNSRQAWGGAIMRRLVQSTFADPKDPGALQGEPLVIHLRSEPTRNRALVVFVHGLGGHRYGPNATWGLFPRFFFDDFPRIYVGFLEYVPFF